MLFKQHIVQEKSQLLFQIQSIDNEILKISCSDHTEEVHHEHCSG